MEDVSLKNPITERDHFSGSFEAPVTLLEYGNFECIHCGSAYPAIKKLRKLLGNQLRFVFRHFPTSRTHPHSVRAAEAAEAAGAQEKFWDMHDELFTHQTALEDHNLFNYARRLRLDIDRFAKHMSEHTFLMEIEADYQRSLFDEHVTGTPTFYINDLRYTGATGVEDLLSAIEQADTEGIIQIPERSGRLQRVLGKLRRADS
jgi:formate-nitrite transporter family protein